MRVTFRNMRQARPQSHISSTIPSPPYLATRTSKTSKRDPTKSPTVKGSPGLSKFAFNTQSQPQGQYHLSQPLSCEVCLHSRYLLNVIGPTYTIFRKVVSSCPLHTQRIASNLVHGMSVLRRLRGNSIDDQAVVSLHNDIVRAVEEEGAMNAGSWKTLLNADRIHSRRRLVIACAIQAFQQLGGINAIIYYSSTLFRNVGFSTHLSALKSGFLQLWFFVASFIPWLLIDRVGRRPLPSSMISVMALVMALVMATQAALVYQVQYKTEVANAAGTAGAVMLFLFEGAFTVGFQATVWVYPSEILPLRLRQKGSSISTAANWICNILIVQITPPAIENVGGRTYIVFAVLNVSRVGVMSLFAGEEGAVTTATMAGNGDPEHLGRSDMVAAKGRVAHKERL